MRYNNGQIHVQQACTLKILKDTLTWSHAPIARRKWVATLPFLEVQVVAYSMLENAHSSVERISRGPQGMTASGLKARHIVTVASAHGNGFYLARLRGRPECRMAHLKEIDRVTVNANRVIVTWGSLMLPVKGWVCALIGHDVTLLRWPEELIPKL